MKLLAQTKAHQAYERGRKAALRGDGLDTCPYLLGKYLHLKNWWMKGFNEARASG